MSSLVDCAARHAANAAFEVPKASDLDKIEVGDYLKVIACGERFWVRVLGEMNDAAWPCVVVNQLANTDRHGLFEGASVSVAPRHVCGIELYEK